MILKSSYNKSSEFLSYDILDEKFIRIFQPFRFVQRILGSCRVDIKDQFVTAPTLPQKCYTIICLTITIICTNNVLQTYSTIFYSEHEMVTLWTGGSCGLLAIFSLSILNVRFFNNESNIQLYIKMQDIDRIMKLGKNEQMYNQHYKQNRAIIFTQVMATSILFIVTAFLIKDKFGIMELFATTWAMTTLICEISCCASHMIYFTKRLHLINCAISARIKKGNINNIKEELCLDDLFNGINLFKNQYRFQVLIFTGSFVVWVLFTAKYAILALQSLQDNIRVDRQILGQDVLHIAVLALLKTLALVGLCTRSDLFVREVDQTKKLIISVMSRYTDGKLRTKAKNMLKLIEESPPCFSVYGIWRVDARLLLNLFNIISSFLIILLQFAFL